VKNLAAGVYPISIAYLQYWGDATMELYWSGPATPRQRVPDAAFTEYYNGYSTYVSASKAYEHGIAVDTADMRKNHLASAALYPNPFDKELKINFYNSASQNDISVGIYDLSGRLLYSRQYGRLPEGVNLLQLDVSSRLRLRAGTYMARLQVNGLPVKTWKIMKIKP
ncbi:MAG: T9SS type A sorting domain-containing protein, partial [Williamsia sp.]|nr:T9SS type A sorting domain-containing protein [Williamsia sp.]